jgi:hypothetical protein
MALEPEPKIEREKIRRPPAPDSRFAAAEPSSESAFQPEPPSTGGPSDIDDGSHSDWTLERRELSAWDDESESHWVLEPDVDDEPEDFVDEEDEAESYIEDDAGIVWENDDRPDEMALDSPDQMVIEDDITFDDYDAGFGATPEVELAGRRDVSPRAPRPVPSPRAANARQATPPRTSRQPAQKQGHQQVKKQHNPRQQKTARQSLAPWEASQQLGDQAESSELRPLEPVSKPEAVSSTRSVEAELGNRPRSQPAGINRPPVRGAKPRGRAEALIIGDAPAQQPLPPPAGGAGRRRRQAGQKPRLAIPPSGRRSSGRRKRSGNGLFSLIAVVLVGVVGWFGYQQIDPAAIQPTIDRITAILPFPSSTRTAEDSSFEGQQALQDLTAEQALSYLEDRALSQNGAAPTSGEQTTGPPIPKFKPLTDDRASSRSAQPATGSNNDDDGTQDASIIKQIIRYINPG